MPSLEVMAFESLAEGADAWQASIVRPASRTQPP